MILIAPDKYKHTLSASRAASIIAEVVKDVDDVIVAPMADGGEGTAEILASNIDGEKRVGRVLVDPLKNIAYVDSSAYIGPACFPDVSQDILSRSSRPLGEAVKSLIDDYCVEKVVIGIGGTFTCDGGDGFLQALGAKTDAPHIDLAPLIRFKDRIVGLSDVQVPLLPSSPDLYTSQPSALTFAPQKGATPSQIVALYHKLQDLQRRLATSPSAFDGAGGGLGYAIASVIGAPTSLGVEAVIDHYNLPWNDIRLIITGEGSVDNQTSLGKVVGNLAGEGRRRGIPVITFGGRVDPDLISSTTISTDTCFPHLPLTPRVAAIRLRRAVVLTYHTIINLVNR